MQPDKTSWKGRTLAVDDGVLSADSDGPLGVDVDQGPSADGDGHLGVDVDQGRSADGDGHLAVDVDQGPNADGDGHPGVDEGMMGTRDAMEYGTTLPSCSAARGT